MRRLLAVASLFVLALWLASEAPAQSKKAAELIKDLDSKDAKVRASAANDLGDLADVRLADAKFAHPKLKELQKDPDPTVRRAVLMALGKIEMDKYPTLLIDALKTDKSSEVQLAAVQAIQQLGPMAKEASPVMQELYKTLLTEPVKTAPKTTTPPNPNMPPADPPAVRRAILAALGAVEPDAKARIPFMIDVLKGEKDNGVRLTLVQGLGQQGPLAKDAVSLLVDLQKALLADSLKATAPKGQQPDLDPQGVRRQILQTLGQIEREPKDFVPRLMDALKTDRAATVRQAAVVSLNNIGPPAKDAIPVLVEVLGKPPVPGDQPGFRRNIIDAIVKIEADTEKQVPLFIDLLKKEKTSAGRLPLVQGLAAIGPPAKAAAPAMMDVYKTSPALPKVMDPDGIRKACVEAVGKVDPEPKTYVPFLVTAVKTDRDVTVKQTAVAALKSIGAPAKEALPALQDIVKSLGKSTKAEDKTLAQEAESAIKAIQGG
jgi:HEAT repeat protein